MFNQKWLERVGPTLFPTGAVFAVQRHDSGVELPPPTTAGLKHAVEKRQREFCAGRLAAKVALEKLGIVGTAVPMAADRSPTWPSGIAGSITHTAELAACVVARKTDVPALGIDLEVTGAVPPEIWDSVFTKDEVAALNARAVAERGPLATLIFSAKEAFYKMQYPLTHQWVEFHAAEVRINASGGLFELACAESSVARLLGGRKFAGHYAAGPELIVTAMHLTGPEK